MSNTHRISNVISLLRTAGYQVLGTVCLAHCAWAAVQHPAGHFQVLRNEAAGEGESGWNEDCRPGTGDEAREYLRTAAAVAAARGKEGR